MSTPPWKFRIPAACGLGLLVLGVGLIAGGVGVAGGLALTGGFAGLAVAFQASEKLRSYSYTMGIFAAVAVAMTFPEVFRKVGNFDLKGLIVPLLQIIMFGMGAQLSLRDFTGVVKQPKGIVVGTVCQFTIMPVVGFSLAKVFGFPPEIAAGIILVGCAPSGLASNVMNFIARANLALSVSLTLVATLLAPVMTPALMKLLAGQFIPVSFWKMLLEITNMVVLPIVAGLAFNALAYGREKTSRLAPQFAGYLVVIALKDLVFWWTTQKGWAAAGQAFAWDVFWFLLLPSVAGGVLHRVAAGSRPVIDWITALVSMVGIGVIITIITAAGRDNLLTIGPLLILACLLHNLLGYALGYGGAKLLGMNQTDCRTIAIEVGLQNGGLASGIALGMGKVATVGLAPAVFGPLMNITGSSLATRWRARPVTDGSGPADPVEGKI